MKHITLNIPDRDYGIVSCCAGAEGITVEALVWESTKELCELILSLPIGQAAGLGGGPDYDRDKVFSLDIDKIAKGEGEA